MKKKFTLFVGTLFLLTNWMPEVAVAQRLICETTLELSAGEQDKVSIEKVQLHKDGTVTVFGLAQRLGQLLRSGEEIAYRKDGAVAWYPALLKFQLSENLKLSSTLQENYHLSSLSGLTEDPSSYLLVNSVNEILGESKTDKTFARLQAEYPEIYDRNKPEKHSYEPAEYMLAGPLLAHTTIRYRYDLLSNSFPGTKSEEIVPLQFPAEDRKTLYVHDRIKVQQRAGLVSMVSGQKQDDQQAYGHYRHQQLRLYNLKGGLLSQYALSFDYPLEMRLHEFIRNQNGQEAGVAYVFGAARRYGQQYTDPDPTNYEVLYVDGEGKEKFRHRYRYGSVYTASEPFFATALNDQLLVLGKGIGKEPDFHLLVFDKDGLKKTTRIDQSVFYENAVGDYRLSLEQSYASQYLVSESKVLEDGSIVFFGEHRALREGAGWNFQAKQQAQATYEYKSYVFLHFNREGDLIGNYMLERGGQSLSSQPAGFQLLSADSNKLQLVLSEPCPADRGPARPGSAGLPAAEGEEVEYQKFGTANTRTVSKIYADRQVRPVIISLNLDARELDVLRFTDDFISLDEHALLHDTLRKELLLVGTSANKQPPLKLIIKKIKL